MRHRYAFTPARLAILLLAVAATLTGCAATHRAIPDTTVELGRSVEDRPITARIIGDGPLVVIVMASIHGSEPVGTPLVHRLAETLRNEPDLLRNRRVILIADANPDGLSAGMRYNAQGVDLNRNFPAPNWRDHERFGDRPLSEPESRALHLLIVTEQPRRIVSIHQPLACIDWDGPPTAEALANRLAAMCDLPVRKLGSRPGSLGAYAGETLGIEVITVEFDRHDHELPAEAVWERYGPMLQQAVVYPQSID